MIFCPDGIIPDTGLTGQNSIYIYIYMCVCVCVREKMQGHQKMILFIAWIIDNLKCFGFLNMKISNLQHGVWNERVGWFVGCFVLQRTNAFRVI